MPNIKTGLFIALGAFGIAFVVVWAAPLRRERAQGSPFPSALHATVGFVTNFFDTLGIGSFATTTSFFRLWRLVRDEVIPGTLNVGHTLPTIVQAFIYIAIVEVEMTTLLLLIGAAVLGMWVGARVVAGWPRRPIQIGMGSALLVAASLLLMGLLQHQDLGGMALGLEGTKLAVGIAGNFILGALMSLGVGLYGPCLLMISLLGMDPKAAFPIMMGSCAFLMPVGSIQFIRTGSYDARAALGLALGGIPAVLIAAFIVRELPLYYLRWLVFGVALYTAFSLLRAAAKNQK